jgi:Down syndrome cell adhesion molecule
MKILKLCFSSIKNFLDFPTDSRYITSNIQQGGYLKINHIDPLHDSGSYTCIVRGRTGEEARRDIQINVNSPPVIEPFLFPKSVQENGRAQISCSVSSGDMPVYFTWYKDGSPMSISLQVTTLNYNSNLSFSMKSNFSSANIR